jgi:hypothetical protein
VWQREAWYGDEFYTVSHFSTTDPQQQLNCDFQNLGILSSTSTSTVMPRTLTVKGLRFRVFSSTSSKLQTFFSHRLFSHGPTTNSVLIFEHEK